MSLVVKGLEYEPMFLWDQTDCKQTKRWKVLSEEYYTYWCVGSCL